MEDIVYGAGLASYPAGVLLRASVYSTNLRAAISLVCADDDMPYGVLSVNLPDAALADDEILVSADWNLPLDLKAALLETGKFVQTGRWNQVGFDSGEVWRIVDADLLSQVAAARVVASRGKSARRMAAVA
ncbi:hypothetical protein SAMN05216345_111152 [Cupriavidus sp. YR651]|uniref:hypothetical protein n=1 Tax=Cupriavidus sp. YR651 TaxID=1855315 RepID=UPI0008852BE3|nr:hypothetical protein [Cupriavidus sp. YR651]SDD58617.1 hypothetical protein SAMN05216345_111152 [Cupriavidus sp. YR651]